MSDDEKIQQVRDQCLAVAHLADAISAIYRDKQKMFNMGHGRNVADLVGNMSARLMENLGDVLNGMDAATEG